MAAATAPPVAAEPHPEVPLWLKNLPLAPEYQPTLEEFQDPISYILKIEKEASKYGICKIIPPVPTPPKKTAITQLNRSLAARKKNPNPKSSPTFTTRIQQIGFCPRRPRPVQRPVWQSGEDYTVQQFEAKAKQFEKSYLKRCGKKGLSALEIETLFWKASVDKPFKVEYANDMPGSAFVPINEKKWREAGEAATVGETLWNMRGVSRAKGSLLRFMKEEIPGVTSPMVYIAMIFSWFAWHVEDHDLHSLNYLHTGAGKTWYGVPREAAVAFEEVIRVHGYGGEVNPLVTFATLGEKTTVMSPEVFIAAGIPCCRLVQNVGEFVVTFPRAYHSGFSHGFNVGEAANIATPEWLTVAKEAAIRRAAVNYPPMVSHYQLLYALALTLCSRVPMSIDAEPRSSRLKDRKRGEGQSMVKELFVQNVVENNGLLHALLEKGSFCVLLPQNSSDMSLCSNSPVKVKPRLSLGLRSNEEGASTMLRSNNVIPNRDVQSRHGIRSLRRKSTYMFEEDNQSLLSAKNGECESADFHASNSEKPHNGTERENAPQGVCSSEQGLFSCVTCGILNFACAAIIQPREAAAQYFMSADCSFFNDWTSGSGVPNDRYGVATEKDDSFEKNYHSGREEKSEQDDGLYDVPVQSGGDYQVQVPDEEVEVVSDTRADKGISSLDLLAFAYGDASDSEEEKVEPEMKLASPGEIGKEDCSPLSNGKNEVLSDDSGMQSVEATHQDGAVDCVSKPSSRPGYRNEDFVRTYQRNRATGRRKNQGGCNVDKGQDAVDCAIEGNMDRLDMESNSFKGSSGNKMVTSPKVDFGSAEVEKSDVKMEKVECRPDDYSMPSKFSRGPMNCLADAIFIEASKSTNVDAPIKNTNPQLLRRSDDDSCRKHIFCLEHAVDVEKQLRAIGGVHMLLVCHPEYPRVEAEAKSLAGELRSGYVWKDIPYREAVIDDRERIRAALHEDVAVPTNADWTVKLGINLYYSASLSQSPIYSKQMPYNSVMYKAFGRTSPSFSLTKPEVSGKGINKQKKIVVAGKWCGKVWMSNQVHPFLAQRDDQEERSESFRSQAATDLKVERRRPRMILPHEKPTRNSMSDITSIISRTDTKKRKRTPEMQITTSPKSPQLEMSSDEAGEESCEDHSTPKRGRVLRSCPMKQAPTLRRSSARTPRTTQQCDTYSKDESEGGPSTRLRKRAAKACEEVKVKPKREKQTKKKKKGGGKARKTKATPSSSNEVILQDEEAEYQCDIEGCTMGFRSKQELAVHKRNICSVKGCGKKFFSHKYLVQHRRVHMDDRPLKCPWRGCKMTFKWAWARTEHIRVHTGARPYVCREPGCGQTFRFVSDFSRHKRKTGHSLKSKK